MLLRNRMSRCTRVRAPEETVDAWARAIREARSVTDPSSGRLHRPRTLAGARNFAPLSFARRVGVRVGATGFRRNRKQRYLPGTE
jgi:hypothetical protein